MIIDYRSRVDGPRPSSHAYPFQITLPRKSTRPCAPCPAYCCNLTQVKRVAWTYKTTHIMNGFSLEIKNHRKVSRTHTAPAVFRDAVPGTPLTPSLQTHMSDFPHTIPVIHSCRKRVATTRPRWWIDLGCDARCGAARQGGSRRRPS